MESKLPSLFASTQKGDPAAAQQLFQVLYAELHNVAKRELVRNGAWGSLGATTLLHEAFLNMSGRVKISFPDRAHFMAYAARAMRGLIIDYVRSRQAQKRGSAFEFTSLDTDIADAAADDHELSRVSEAIDELATVDAELAQLVELKFFCGFSIPEIADIRGVSERTVQRDWEKARLYLHRALKSDFPLL
ncbi:MAG TPA: ECF-type sigma factor [Casimicrobiaceae bacterium]